MATKNIVSATISPEDLAEIKTKVQEIIGKMPFLISLTPEERAGGIKMGDRTVSFVDKSIDYMANNPELVPPYIDVSEVREDRELNRYLGEILHLLLPLVQNIEDTMMEAGIEALGGALAFYNSVRHAARNNVANAKAIYEDLSTRFPKRGKRDKTECQ